MKLPYLEHKTVVVTGAAGFIGSHLCDRLLAEGAKVVGIDNFLTGRPANLEHLLADQNEQFTFIEADVNNHPETYLSSMTDIDLVLHFASPASPPRYQAHPVETYLVNSLATHQILQYLLHRHPEARFLFASTSEVYGDPQIHPQVEGYWGNVNPNGVRSCYDEAKRLGETICGVHQRDFGMDVRMVRIFNTYGPRIDPDDGRIIPNLLKQALAGDKLTVYGDGSQTRSYCYVDDLVEGILRLASFDNLSGETVNLGNPGEFTVLETAEIIRKEINESLEIAYLPLPKDDPTRRRPDISKAKHLLDWEPQVTFEEGLQKTIEFFRR